MYADPRKIKKYEIKFRADDELNAMLEQLQERTGEQKAVIVRDLVMAGLARYQMFNKQAIEA